MNKLLFSLTFIFAFSSWSWSWVTLKLDSADFHAEYKLELFIPNGKLLGNIVAKTQNNGECKGGFVLNQKGELHMFFDGPDGIGSKGGCSYESSIIALGEKGLKLLDEALINAEQPVTFETCLFEDDLVREGQITLTGRE